MSICGNGLLSLCNKKRRCGYCCEKVLCICYCTPMKYEYKKTCGTACCGMKRHYPVWEEDKKSPCCGEKDYYPVWEKEKKSPCCGMKRHSPVWEEEKKTPCSKDYYSKECCSKEDDEYNIEKLLKLLCKVQKF